MKSMRLDNLAALIATNPGAGRPSVMYLNEGVDFGEGPKDLWTFWHMEQRTWNDGITVAMAILERRRTR